MILMMFSQMLHAKNVKKESIDDYWNFYFSGGSRDHLVILSGLFQLGFECSFVRIRGTFDLVNKPVNGLLIIFSPHVSLTCNDSLILFSVSPFEIQIYIRRYKYIHMRWVLM